MLSDEEKRQFKALLNGDIYNKMTSVRRNYLILRLDSMVSDGAATYSSKSGLLTIEHILPQTLEKIPNGMNGGLMRVKKTKRKSAIYTNYGYTV